MQAGAGVALLGLLRNYFKTLESELEFQSIQPSRKQTGGVLEVI